jgi:hypothetical protein
MKVGRNDPCPCGGGSKYKKCCIPKYDQTVPNAASASEDFESFAERTWMADKLKDMSEAEILRKLDKMGIRTDKMRFVKEVGGHIGVDKVIGKWMSRLSPAVDVPDEEFLVLAAKELWNRWLPDQFAVHRIEDMLVDYLDNDPGQRILERFVDIWTVLRDRVLVPYKCRSFDQFEDKFNFPFELDVIFFDTEADMIQECREHPANWDRLTLLYRDMLDYLTEMQEDNKLNVRRSYAEAHFYKGDENTANKLFKQLIDDHPEWVWGYVGWGDMYNPRLAYSSNNDKDEAVRLYRLGLEKASSDKDILEERIKELTIQ